jgi:hypothetical protein
MRASPVAILKAVRYWRATPHMRTGEFGMWRPHLEKPKKAEALGLA